MGIPAPFQRPSIDLGDQKKQWLDIVVQDVEVGDIVQDFGLVKATRVYKQSPSLPVVEISFARGTRETFPLGSVVRAFTRTTRG